MRPRRRGPQAGERPSVGRPPRAGPGHPDLYSGPGHGDPNNAPTRSTCPRGMRVDLGQREKSSPAPTSEEPLGGPLEAATSRGDAEKGAANQAALARGEFNCKGA